MRDGKKKPSFKLRSSEQMTEELAQIIDEAEQMAWFEQIVKDFDKAEELNNLKHYRKNRRHCFDPHWLDIDLDKEITIPQQMKILNHSDMWLEHIFSQNPDDLHELMENEMLCKTILDMNDKRKEVLFYRIVHGYTTQDIAKMKGVSDRNIRKLYEKAITEIKEAIYNNPEFIVSINISNERTHILWKYMKNLRKLMQIGSNIQNTNIRKLTA